MKDMKMVHMVAFGLLVIGGVNWGLIGLFNYNLVGMIFGMVPMLERVVYILVGVSAIYLASTHMQDCKTCSMNMKMKK